MLDTPTITSFPAATDADGKLLLSAEEALALLRECFAEFKLGLHELVAMSIEQTNDLFEMNEYVSDADALLFRSKRREWATQFEEKLTALFEKRLAGKRRSGRRPDFDASLTTLRVLNSFDQEKQAALTEVTALLRRVTRREVEAVDLRVGLLLREARARDTDNPFSPDYLADAVGVTSRELYPNPRIWRPLMERILGDVKPGLNKLYIRLNRYLAEHHVLPEIKAELRARSELRPADDSELLPAFLQLFKEAGPSVADALLALNIEVPPAAAVSAALPPSPSAPPKVAMPPPMAPAGASPGPTAAPPTAVPGAGGAQVSAPGTLAPTLPMPAGSTSAPVGNVPAGAQLSEHRFVPVNPYAVDIALPAPAPALAPGAAGLPQLDPMLALGSLSAAVAALDRWQRADPGGEYVAAQDLPAGEQPTALPLNRIPFIRAAISDKMVNSGDKITMDVIGLLFDYIFRDPSIPESLRSLFSRLQVPILKTALIDRSFFSNKKHPARRLLDHLAAAAIGATGDAGYCAAFELIAAGVIEEICRDFKVDMAAFEAADVRLQEFVDVEQRKLSTALDTEVVEALSAEKGEADRAHVRVLIRDKLAGLDVPFDVRAFNETVWADYLTEIRSKQGAGSAEWQTAVQTLDELMWSITAKERTGQKARLAKLVPSIIRNLRAGAAAVKVTAERVQPFLDVIYQMHMAAIKPKSTEAAPAAAAAVPVPVEGDTIRDIAAPTIGNVHDFVNEMVVGTWLAFGKEGKTTNAKLSWVSPLRSKYIFTSRARTKAIVVTPEELAWQLGAGKATLVVEPVPLFDRAVSAALDKLAARMPAGATPVAA
jgi:Protein of unknown function (DUF1631)